MSLRPSWFIGPLVAVLAIATTPALGSTADEVTAGRAVAQRLQAGKTSCDQLTDTDFEQLGEFAMERLAGSRTVHEAMNRQMAAMLGSAAADRMHRLVGLRYAGCATGATMGPAMMGGGAASGAGWGAMMGSRDVSWMRNGTWQHMDRGAWQRVGTAWMGPGMMRSRNDGWSAADVLAAIAGAVLVGVLIAFAIPKPAGQDPGGPPRKAAETSR